MVAIHYNETSDYQYARILGVEGVYTPLRIQRDSLPEGFYKYSLRDGEVSYFGSISKSVLADHAGDFITKEAVKAAEHKEIDLSESDWSFEDKDFEFESFFGTKLSIDTQIQLAEAKREQQLESKGLGKQSIRDNKAKDVEAEPTF